ncbi:MAG: peptidase M48, partial [Rubricoccaceae bacterium]|nr:peptidase M48 [Rubricoccaceae bacterium]
GFLAYFIEYGGNLYQFMGLTGAGNMNRYSSTFSSSIESFARLTNASYLNRQPVRLDVVSADRNAQFSSFLSGRPTPDGFDSEGLAILNQVQMNQSIPRGYQLKLPR